MRFCARDLDPTEAVTSGNGPRRMYFDVYGHVLRVERHQGLWRAWWVGVEGKRRRADIVLPPDASADDLGMYLEALFHEQATPAHPSVRRLAD